MSRPLFSIVTKPTFARVSLFLKRLSRIQYLRFFVGDRPLVRARRVHLLMRGLRPQRQYLCFQHSTEPQRNTQRNLEGSVACRVASCARRPTFEFVARGSFLTRIYIYISDTFFFFHSGTIERFQRTREHVSCGESRTLSLEIRKLEYSCTHERVSPTLSLSHTHQL